MELGLARVEVAGGWSLDEFMVLLRRYRQLYAFSYAINTEPLDESLKEKQSPPPDKWERKRRSKFHAYPWRGGFSTINFFGSIESHVPREERIRIFGIRVESPGYLDLVANLGPIGEVCSSVLLVSGTVGAASKAVRSVLATLKERNLNNLDVRKAESALKRDDEKYIMEAIAELEATLQITPKQAEYLRKRSGDKRLAELKIMVGASRRVLELARLEDEGKISVQMPRPLSKAERLKMETEIADELARRRQSAEAQEAEEEEQEPDEESGGQRPSGRGRKK